MIALRRPRRTEDSLSPTYCAKPYRNRSRAVVERQAASAVIGRPLRAIARQPAPLREIPMQQVSRASAAPSETIHRQRPEKRAPQLGSVDRREAGIFVRKLLVRLSSWTTEIVRLRGLSDYHTAPVAQLESELSRLAAELQHQTDVFDRAVRRLRPTIAATDRIVDTRRALRRASDMVEAIQVARTGRSNLS